MTVLDGLVLVIDDPPCGAAAIPSSCFGYTYRRTVRCLERNYRRRYS